MTKSELSDLLHEICDAVDEGIASQENNNKYSRIVYWPYVEKDEMSSGKGYINMVTYQISLFDRKPQGDTYKKLRECLRERGIHPTFYHEYIEKDPIFEKAWHTYFSIDVQEEIDECICV